MTVILKTSLLAIASFALLSSEASAQYYNPAPAPQYGQQSVNGGFGLGLNRNGFNPSIGFGAGPVGAGLGAGIGRNGVGTGFNTGVGPLGVAANGGLGRNGLGLGASGGIGNTGAAFDGGFSRGGLGFGTSAKLLGFGPGASLGIGKRGAGLGASMAFGPLGTLSLGNHRNSYPGAQQTAAHIYPNQNASYYTQQNYGQSPNSGAIPVRHYNQVQSAPVRQPQHLVSQPQYRTPGCPANWTC